MLVLLLNHQFFSLHSLIGLNFNQVKSFCQIAHIQLNQVLVLEFLLLQQRSIHIENTNGNFSLQVVVGCNADFIGCGVRVNSTGVI